MGDDSDTGSTGSRADTYRLIGGTIKHICVYDNEEIGNGVSINVEKDGKEYTFHVYLPNECHTHDHLEIESWN